MPKKTLRRKKLDTALRYLVKEIAELVAILAHPESTKTARQDARRTLERLGGRIPWFPAEGPEEGTREDVEPDPFRELDGW